MDSKIIKLNNKNERVIIEDVTEKLLSLTEFKEIANKLDDDDLLNISEMIGFDLDFLTNGGYYNIWEKLAKKHAKKYYTEDQSFDDFLNEFVLYFFVDREIHVYRAKLNINPTEDDFLHGYENVRKMVDNGDATIYQNYLYFTDRDAFYEWKVESYGDSNYLALSDDDTIELIQALKQL